MARDRSGPPFRADHVGSLLRPRALVDAFKAHRVGKLDDDAFVAAQGQAIRDVVRRQEAVGLSSITDGEFRRLSYWARFVERVAGLEVRDACFNFHDEAGQNQAFTAPHAASKVRRTQSIAGDEYDFLARCTTETPKITLPSPPTMHFWRLNDGIDPAAYATMGEYFVDLAAVYAEEIADLAARGARYIQLDDVPLPMLCDPLIQSRVRDAALDPEDLIDAYIDLFNRCLEGRPSEVTVAVHLCRGNYKGKFLSKGGYEAIAEKFFNELDVDAFFLEYDTPRAGDFAPLRFMPQEKIAVLSIVSSKTPILEEPDALAARIDEASQYLALQQLALSPQCGFASTVAGNPVSEDDEVRKLSLVVDVAGRVWG